MIPKATKLVINSSNFTKWTLFNYPQSFLTSQPQILNETKNPNLFLFLLTISLYAKKRGQ